MQTPCRLSTTGSAAPSAEGAARRQGFALRGCSGGSAPWKCRSPGFRSRFSNARCEVCVRSVQTQLRCHGLHERRPLPGVRARRWRLRTHRRRATFAADLIGTSPPRTLRDGDQKGGKQGEWRWDRERRERERERQSRLVVESQSREREPTAAHSAGRDDGVACSLPGNVAEYERSTEAQRQRPSARRVIFAPGPHATGLSGAASAPAPTALILVHR